MLKDWRFSWRSVGAALGAAAICGLLFGLVFSLLDLSVSPEEAESFLSQTGLLAVAATIALFVLGGLLLLIVSLASRLTPWPRPWLEAAIAGAALVALTAGGDLLSFRFTTAHGDLPSDHIVSILGGKVVPAAIAALFPLVYWALNKARAGRGA